MTTSVQTEAALIGGVLLILGIAGFPSNTTIGYHALEFVGHPSSATPLEAPTMAIPHTVVHIAAGLAGIALARSTRTAKGFLTGGGALYLMLWLYGLIMDEAAGPLRLTSINSWLYCVLGVVMMSVGWVLGARENTATERPQSPGTGHRPIT
nr:DUF4383 domain-containing protein [Kibdelosporangium sp. MJ126-NF4]CEL17472.1 hypothetical protein [Kibdelosporangium sp. MJ126-NF4]CTQ91301.1 hypothetical protein [Kibdelosporangium sp. MJ126-NF4]